MAFFTSLIAGLTSVFTTIGTFFSGLGALGTFFLRAAVGIGLSLLGQALAGKPKKPGFSVQGKIQSGEDTPRSFIFGFGATAGSLVYANSWGKSGDTPNAYFTQVICVGDKPYNGIWAVWVNNEKVTLLIDDIDEDKGIPVDEYRKGGKDHLWIKFYDGTQTAADDFLVNEVSSTDRPYGTDRVGYGCPYIVATSLVDDELWTGFPSFKFEFLGIHLYDISKDSTAGGDGDQRADNPATWGGDGDFLPAVQIYNLLMGIKYEDQWLYGLQSLPLSRLPAANWIAMINKCRLEIEGPGGMETQYKSGGEIQVGAPIADAIEGLLSACQGRLSEFGGIYEIFLGAPGDPTFVVSDDDILSTEEQTFTPFFGLDSTINGVAAKYPSPGDGWVSKVAPPLYRPDLEVLDGNRRLMADVSLDLVPFPFQVQRLQKSALEEARRFRRHTIALPPEYWAYAVPNAFFSWNSSRNGYITKLFRVDGCIDRNDLSVIVDVTEVDPTDYDFDLYIDYIPPIDNPPVVTYPPPQTIVDWSASAETIVGDDGSLRPAIKLNWDGTQLDVDLVMWEVRRFATEEVMHQGNTSNVEAATAYITQSIIRKTTYEVRGRYHSLSGRRQLWSNQTLDSDGNVIEGPWITVTTPDIGVINVPGDITDGIIDLSKISDQFQNALDEISQSVMRVRDETRQIQQNLADAEATLQGTVYNNNQLIKLETENSFAAIYEETAIRLTETTALYTSLNAVVLQVEDPVTGLSALGSIIEGQQIQIENAEDDISILVSDYVALEARVDDAEGDIIANATSISAQTVRIDSLKDAATGTAQAGSSSSITLASGASSVTNYYVGLPITITGGTGSGQTRRITAYNGTTKVATITPNWTVNPNNTSTYSLGAASMVAMATQVNTVETSVAGNTSSISTLQSSYNGLAVKYGVIGTINGTTGGFLLEGIEKLDGTVTYDVTFSVDTFTVARASNLIRNGMFSANGGTVNPAAAWDIARWYINANPTAFDVIAASSAPAGCPTPFCLSFNLGTAGDIYSDYNYNTTVPDDKGIPVVSGDKFTVAFKARGSSGTLNINVKLVVRTTAGSLVEQSSATGGSIWTPGINSSAFDTYKNEFTIGTNGKAFLRIYRSSTSGTVYITDIQVLEKNGALVIVDGTIVADHLATDSVTTKKINGQAVTTPIFGYEDVPIVGTGLGGSAAGALTLSDLSVNIPNGDTVYVKADFTVYLSYTGNGGWRFTADIVGVSGSIEVESPSGSTTRQTAVSISKVEEYTSASDGPLTIAANLAFRGESTVTVEYWTGSLVVGKR